MSNRLSNVIPLNEWATGDLSMLADDSAVTVQQDHGDGKVVMAIGPDAGLTVQVDVSGDILWAEFDLSRAPGQQTLQRVNRLLDGSGWSLKSYHRAGGEVQVNGDGRYQALPARLTFDAGSGEWSYARRTSAPLGAAVPTPAEQAVVAEADVLRAVTTTVASPVAAPVAEADLLQHPTVTPKTEVKVKRDVVEGLDMLWKLHTSGKRQVLCLIGPTGTGKTSLVYDLAARNGVGIFTFDCAGAREFSDFVGVTHLRGTETVFVPSGLLKVLDKAGPYGGQPRIVNLDEITRAESAQALNALISMLHDFARIYVPEAGVAFDLDPAVMFTMTANRGAQYTGTVGLDLALANRVTAWVKMEYAESGIEAKVLVERTGIEPIIADRLVSAAKRIRDMDERGELPEGGGVSTRLLLKAAEKVVAGFSPHAAAAWTWVGNYTDEGGTQSEAYQVQSAIDMTLR